jgi:DNA repair protein RecO (recombination protein O)
MTINAFIIDSTAVKDNDLIVTVFSEPTGKASIYAKGANKSNSKRKNSLELFNKVSLSMTEKGDGRKFLNEVKIQSSCTSIKNSSHLHAECFLLLEFLKQVLVEDENQEQLFSLLNELTVSKDSHRSLWNYNYILLKTIYILGFLPQLNYCVRTGEKLESSDNIVKADNSIGYRKIEQASTSENASLIKLIKSQLFILRNAETIEDFYSLRLDEKDLLQLANIHTDWAEYIIERPLKSRYLLNSIK